MRNQPLIVTGYLVVGIGLASLILMPALLFCARIEEPAAQDEQVEDLERKLKQAREAEQEALDLLNKSVDPCSLPEWSQTECASCHPCC